MALTNIPGSDCESYIYLSPSGSSTSLSTSGISSGASTPGSYSSDEPELCFSNISTPDTELSESQIFLTAENTLEEEYALVVGGLGYIGSHTTWELLRSGKSVIVVDNLSNSYRNVLQKLEALVQSHYTGKMRVPDLHFYEADYRKRSAMKSILERYDSVYNLKTTITSVIHFAAYKAVEESIRQPLMYYSNNVAGLIDFCTLLDDFNIKTLVFSSSATV
jgi:UDP-glucose 4-epimerase